MGRDEDVLDILGFGRSVLEETHQNAVMSNISRPGTSGDEFEEVDDDIFKTAEDTMTKNACTTANDDGQVLQREEAPGNQSKHTGDDDDLYGRGILRESQ